MNGNEAHQSIREPASDGDFARNAQHAAAHDVHRLLRGGAVERLGGAGAPVDHERLVLLVTDADAPDVADLALLGLVERGGAGEFAAAAFANCVGELVMEIGEKQERALRSVRISHE